MRTAIRLFVLRRPLSLPPGRPRCWRNRRRRRTRERHTRRPLPNRTPAGPVPRLRNGKPDLSGLWANPYTPNMAAKGTVLDPATRKPITVSGAELADAKAFRHRRRQTHRRSALHGVGPQTLEDRTTR